MVQRFDVTPGSLIPNDDGKFVLYDEAQATIKKLGDELFAARAALHAQHKAAQASIELLGRHVEKLTQRAQAACAALGYPVDDDDS